jgi:hypothetical protein
MDVNGDGKKDLVQQWNKNGLLSLGTYLSTGSGFQGVGWYNTSQAYASNPDGTPDLLIMDVNGDGKKDLVQQWNKNGLLSLGIYLSTGSGFQGVGWYNTSQAYGRCFAGLKLPGIME